MQLCNRHGRFHASWGVCPQAVLWEFGSLSPARTFVKPPPAARLLPRWRQFGDSVSRLDNEKKIKQRIDIKQKSNMGKLKKNIWNIIGVIGTVATLFFGIYGLIVIPNYAVDAKKQRQETANNEIVRDIKEILFSDVKIDSLFVPALVQGKEIKYNINYPMSNNAVLVQVQESFMGDKFLPLEQRMYLHKKIDSLKLITPEKTTVIEKSESKNSLFSILTYILSILSIIISILLFYALITKRKQQIADELEEKFNEIQDAQPEAIVDYRNFESKVESVIRKLDLNYENYTMNPKGFPFDFLINHKNRRIGVEVKSRLRQDVLSQIRKQFDKSDLDALIIVANQIPDFSTFSMLSDIRKNYELAGKRIYFVTAPIIDKLKDELMEILKMENK